MGWKEAADQYCSIARALGILGDRWTLLIVREAFSGVRRFDDFRRHLGIARNILTDRLQRLVETGVLELKPYQDNPPRYEYRLTECGKDLNGVLASLLSWGDRWLAGDAGPPLLICHKGCGQAIVPELRCPYCGEVLHAQNTYLTVGPGLPNDVAASRAHELHRLRAERTVPGHAAEQNTASETPSPSAGRRHEGD